MAASILSQIGVKTASRPPRTVLCGVPGVGKTTFVCNTPRPFIIAVEEGMVGFEYVQQWQPKNFTDFKAMLEGIIGAEPGTLPFETLVIDTLDALERMIYEHLCVLGRVDSIEEYGKGFGKGFTRGRELLEGVMSDLDSIGSKHNIPIWITSHAMVKPMKRPDGVIFDAWTLKGNEKFNSSLTGWADMVLFANIEAFQAGDAKDRKANEGERVLYTEKSLISEGKNRYGLPPVLAFEYAAFAAEMAKVHRPTLEAKAASLIASSTLAPAEKKAKSAEIPTLPPNRLRAFITWLEGIQAESTTD